MTTVAHGSPVDSGDGERIPIHTAEFSQNPHAAYEAMRERFGSLVPVELAPGVPATLVIGYHEAREILNDDTHFPADPRRWQKSVPETCPVLPMMKWLPAPRYCTGAEHARYRGASVDAVDRVDLMALHDTVEHIALDLVGKFPEDGRADLLTAYAFPLVFRALNAIVGCPADLGEQLANGMAARFDAVEEKAARGFERAKHALTKLVRLKCEEPGDDIATRLIRHPARLDGRELIAQLMSVYGAGIEAMTNLLANTVALMLTDERFGGGLFSGGLSNRDALDEVLFRDPPIANFCFSYPPSPKLIDGMWLPAHQPVVVSLAACNNDPAVAGGDRTGNRSHLAWGMGSHACPATDAAYLIVCDGVTQLLDAVPDIRLAVPKDELVWRPGPFHRALTALPVEHAHRPRRGREGADR